MVVSWVGGMRQARIKLDAEVGEAVYHCMSRTVNGEMLFDDTAKEVLRKQLWRVANYCGVEIVTYAIMANHFHVLIRVPQSEPVSDPELLRRFAVLYPKPTKYQSVRLEAVKAQLVVDGPDAVAWRARQLALMGDVSAFMKLVKQRFSIWFNRTYHRFGTLWAERFKSVLVEPRGHALRTMTAYIDLNAVRAGLVEDPKDYRFCGYAEAVAGNTVAQQNLAWAMGHQGWTTGQSAYRLLLFGIGTRQRMDKASVSESHFQQVVRQKGELALSTVLRTRIRYFSDGAVLGSKAFVADYLSRFGKASGQRPRTAPRLVPELKDWGELTTMRGLRRSVSE